MVKPTIAQKMGVGPDHHISQWIVVVVLVVVVGVEVDVLVVEVCTLMLEQ